MVTDRHSATICECVVSVPVMTSQPPRQPSLFSRLLPLCGSSPLRVSSQWPPPDLSAIWHPCLVRLPIWPPVGEATEKCCFTVISVMNFLFCPLSPATAVTQVKSPSWLCLWRVLNMDIFLVYDSLPQALILSKSLCLFNIFIFSFWGDWFAFESLGSSAVVQGCPLELNHIQMEFLTYFWEGSWSLSYSHLFSFFFACDCYYVCLTMLFHVL